MRAVTPERIMYHYPIVHSQVEMGAFSETIRKVTVQKLGPNGGNAVSI